MMARRIWVGLASLFVAAVSVTAQPAITTFTPVGAYAGTTVSVTGTGFTGATMVTVNSMPASFTVNSDTNLTLTVPLSSTTGKIGITTGAGTAQSAITLSVLYHYSISAGPSTFTPGTPVLLNSGQPIFGSVQAISLNGTPVTSYTVNSAYQINMTVPAGATSGIIGVQANPYVASSQSVRVLYPPTVTSLAPETGTIGTLLTISGSQLSAVTNVRAGSINLPFSIVSSNAIRALWQRGATSGPVTVINTDGSATTTNSFFFDNPVGISGFTPTNGPATTAVTISGNGFSDVIGVRFGQSNATYVVDSANQITAVVPLGAPTASIAVLTETGGASTTNTFTVENPVTITNLSTNAAVAGTIISIQGDNIGGATEVTFNGMNAGFSTVSAGEISATVPTNSGVGILRVVTPLGIGTTNFDGSYVRITGFTPASGNPGSSVIISGQNLLNCGSVYLGTAPASFTVNSDSQITVTVPLGATTNAITVSTPVGYATTASKFDVIYNGGTGIYASPTVAPPNAMISVGGNISPNYVSAVSINGQSATFNRLTSTLNVFVPLNATSGYIGVTQFGLAYRSDVPFTVSRPPSISGFSPTNGPAGTLVTIYGSEFTGITNVNFNGSTSVFSVVSSSVITATVPAAAATGKIGVKGPYGGNTNANNFVLTAAVATKPTIDSMKRDGDNIRLSFTPATNFRYYTEMSEVLGTNWNQTFSVWGDGNTKTIIDPSATSTQKFYRFVAP